MKLSTQATSLALLTTLAVSAFAPMALADSSNTQKDKNNMRTLGIAGAAHRRLWPAQRQRHGHPAGGRRGRLRRVQVRAGSQSAG